ERSGRKPDALKLSFQIMVASGSNDEEVEHSRGMTKGQIAFYGSTPAYKVVLDAHGWGDLQPELNTLSKRGAWNEMTSLISDEMLEAVAICCPMGEVAQRVHERCGHLADRVSLLAHWARDPEPWAEVARELADR
ncbi:MAG: LLM class flavin-dependent oxidoreductase, partial [Myxococcota bacterium]